MTTRGRFALSQAGAACWCAAVVAYLLVLLTGDGWLLAVVAAGLTLPLVDLGFACRADVLRGEREPRAVAGQQATVRLARSRRGGPESDLVATVFPPAGAVRAQVDAGADTAVLRYPAGARGAMPALRWMTDAYGPLGLAARRRHGVDETRGLVHPASAEPLTAPFGGAPPGDGATLRLAMGGVLAGVRGYRTGDSARAVHWRSTARRGVPVVREWSAESGRGLVVAAGRFGPETETRLAQVAATTVAALERGVPVTLVGSGAPVCPVGAGEALDWFALLVGATTAAAPAGPVPLRSHERYTLDAPVPAAGRDSVEAFLFDDHEGFCEQFASAETVLLRSVGVPARLATGFAYGTPGTGSQTSRRVFTAADAHAWVEVSYPGLGWSTSDPTAGAQLVGPARSLVVRFRAFMSSVGSSPLRRAAAAGILGALAVIVALLAARGRRRLAARRRTRALGPVSAAFARLERRLPREAGATPREYVATLPGDLTSALAAWESELFGLGAGDREVRAALTDVRDVRRRR